MRSASALFACFVALGCTESSSPVLKVVDRSGQHQLSRSEQEIVISHVESILRTCNLNSRTHADFPIEWPSNYSEIWDAASSGSHLIVSYSDRQSFDTIGGTVTARQILVALPRDKLPSQPLTRSGTEFLGYEKCDGYTMVQFACDAQLADVPAFAEGARSLCKQ